METESVTIYLSIDENLKDLERIMEIRKIMKGVVPDCILQLKVVGDKVESFLLENMLMTCPVGLAPQLVRRYVRWFPESSIGVYVTGMDDLRTFIRLERDKVNDDFADLFDKMVVQKNFEIDIPHVPSVKEDPAENNIREEATEDAVAENAGVIMDRKWVSKEMLAAMNIRIQDSKLSPCVKQLLANVPIMFLGELCEKTKSDLCLVHGFSPYRIGNVEEFMAKRGMRFKKDEETHMKRIQNWNPDSS